jgi:hypothetical protein
MKTKDVETLLRIVLSDWDLMTGERRRCQFCGALNPHPKQERHFGGCPRYIWALARKDSPKDRAERYARKEFPNWRDALIIVPTTEPVRLQNDGPIVLDVLQRHLEEA